MPGDAHDVGLAPRLVDGILHRLAIHRQRFVLPSPGPVPLIERPIQRPRLNPHQAVSNHIFAGHDIASVLAPAVKTFAGFLPQRIGPISNGLVPAHAAQGSARRDAQHHRQTMAPPLAAARIGNGLETLPQLAHLFGIAHDLRGSSQLQSISVEVR